MGEQACLPCRMFMHRVRWEWMHSSAALRVGAVCAAAVRATIAPGRGQGPLSPHDVQGPGEARRATSAYIERRASSCHEGRKV
jgi:hypothetical protein